MLIASDHWTCPDCGETTTGNSRTRRAAQHDHAKEHGTADKPRLCTTPGCGKPFSPLHDRTADGPTVRHPFTTADMPPAQNPVKGVRIPPAPMIRPRKR